MNVSPWKVQWSILKCSISRVFIVSFKAKNMTSFPVDGNFKMRLSSRWVNLLCFSPSLCVCCNQRLLVCLLAFSDYSFFSETTDQLKPNLAEILLWWFLRLYFENSTWLLWLIILSDFLKFQILLVPFSSCRSTIGLYSCLSARFNVTTCHRKMLSDYQLIFHSDVVHTK